MKKLVKFGISAKLLKNLLFAPQALLRKNMKHIIRIDMNKKQLIFLLTLFSQCTIATLYEEQALLNNISNPDAVPYYTINTLYQLAQQRSLERLQEAEAIKQKKEKIKQERIQLQQQRQKEKDDIVDFVLSLNALRYEKQATTIQATEDEIDEVITNLSSNNVNKLILATLQKGTNAQDTNLENASEYIENKIKKNRLKEACTRCCAGTAIGFIVVTCPIWCWFAPFAMMK